MNMLITAVFIGICYALGSILAWGRFVGSFGVFGRQCVERNRPFGVVVTLTSWLGLFVGLLAWLFIDKRQAPLFRLHY
jgi:uncharacterized membrane protein YecN with MAPEG domain